MRALASAGTTGGPIDAALAYVKTHLGASEDAYTLGIVANAAGEHPEAKRLHERALAIREKALGPDHPHVATTCNNLAGLCYAEGKYAEAEPL